MLCVLLFDIWGALGIAIGVLIRQLAQHPELGLIPPFAIALENAVVFWATVNLSLKAMGVGKNIEHITYIKIVLLAFFCSVTHGFLYTFLLFKFEAIPTDNYLRESLVSIISGFFGTMAIVLILTFAIRHSPWLQSHTRAIEND